MKLRLSDIRRAITQVVQPLRRATFVSKIKLRATLKDAIPFGTHDGYVDSSPFGFNSNPATKVFGYILNLGGDRLAPIIIAHQHNARPEITQGGSVQYSTDVTGDTLKATIECLPDGTIRIKSIAGSQIELTPDGKITIGSSGSSEPLILGNVFTIFFNAHTHIGNLGVPTGGPMTPMSASEISTKSFTEL